VADEELLTACLYVLNAHVAANGVYYVHAVRVNA
jgi:hypothetical protein